MPVSVPTTGNGYVDEKAENPFKDQNPFEDKNRIVEAKV